VKPVASGDIDVPTRVVKTIVQTIASIQTEALDSGKPIALPWGLKRLSTGAKLLAGGT